MKVVLRSDVSGIGRKGDVRDVANGYARNFLLPRGLAFKATPGVEAQAEGMRRARSLKQAEEPPPGGRTDEAEVSDYPGEIERVPQAERQPVYAEVSAAPQE